MAIENVRLLSPLMDVDRRNFTYGTAAELNPNDTNPLIDGEWLELNSSYQLDRGSGTPATVPSFMVLTERGRYDTQALGQVTVAYMGMFEAKTRVFTSASIALGAGLHVTNSTVDALTRRGLQVAASAGMVVGFTTKVTDGTGWTRFVRVSPYILA